MKPQHCQCSSMAQASSPLDSHGGYRAPPALPVLQPAPSPTWSNFLHLVPLANFHVLLISAFVKKRACSDTQSAFRPCFGMHGGNSAWPKEQDWRSFLLCKMVECLACNLAVCGATGERRAEDLCAQDFQESIRLSAMRNAVVTFWSRSAWFLGG